MTRPRLDSDDRVVVKVGSASLAGPDGEPDEDRLVKLCDQLVAARERGIAPILVSSGAIAAGLRPLGLSRRPSDIPSLQAAAAVGQGRLLGAYTHMLAARGVVAAQVLLTRHDVMQRQQYLNARNTLERLLELGALPIVNENDTVATDEIRFGDNDLLAALVSNLASARCLVLLTDAAGVHTRDPRVDPGARLLDEIDRITPELERAAGGGGSLGTGGMASKIAAAWVATFSGVATVVADAREERVLERVVAGEAVGTYFRPRSRRVSARRLWIAFAHPPRGTVEVDDGARRAVVESKKSLLAVGVTGCRGAFGPGDAVDVASGDGTVFARGLVRLGAAELEAVRGRPSSESGERREVIHRDQLVVLDDD